MATAGCNCQPVKGIQDCSATAMAQAQTQVDDALSGNNSCAQDSDCVLVQTPCQLIDNNCGFDFSAVSVTGQAAVEHAFSVTSAEVCSTCTPVSTNNNFGNTGNTSCTFGTPGASCSKGRCTVVPVPPDAGSFELECNPTCNPGEYCDVETEVTSCTGLASYIILSGGGGSCLSSSGSFGGSSFCTGTHDCPLGQNCAGADTSAGKSGTCTTFCPNGLQPTFCDGGCTLTPDNHGCNVCFCPNGCPVFQGDGG